MSSTLVGVSWRMFNAKQIEECREFVDILEVMTEELASLKSRQPLLEDYASVNKLRAHSATLSLGSTCHPDSWRLDEIRRVLVKYNLRSLSEHIAFVRSGQLDAWHLLPMPMIKESINILANNVSHIRDILNVSVSLENIVPLFRWADDDYSEPEFISAVIKECKASLLLDIENIRITCKNFNMDPYQFISKLPIESISAVHIAGGIVYLGRHRDTHSEDISYEVLELLAFLAKRVHIPEVILERESQLTSESLYSQLKLIRAALT